MADSTAPESPLAKAVRLAGGQSAFGRIIGRPQPTVWDWLDQGKPLPAEYVLTVESATGVSRHELRPDIYPFDSPAAQQGLPGSMAPAGKGIAGKPPAASCGRRPVSQLGEAAR